MGSERRRDAIAAGLPVENAEATRKRLRREASIMREELAIEMWASGKKSTEISDELFRRFGVRLSSSIPELVRRGLYRRVEEGAENAEIARELFRERYQGLLRAWYPRASDEVNPDPVAVGHVLRILRDWGVIEGIVAPARGGDLNLAILQGVQLDDGDVRDRVLASLAAEREKQNLVRTIEGETTSPEVHDDGKTPPPTFVLPKRPD